MKNLKTRKLFEDHDEPGKPRDLASWKLLYKKFAEALEKKKTPCNLKLTQTGDKFEFTVECGFNYSDSVADKVDAAAHIAGVQYGWYSVCAEGSGDKDHETQWIAGGPKRPKNRSIYVKI